MEFNLKAALEGGVKLLAARMSENLTSRGKVASGALGESISVTVRTPRKGRWIAEILMLDYWEAVDQGRKAGTMPPIQSIKDWLKWRAVKDRLTFGREGAFDANSTDSIAYAIAKKIERVGTIGSNFATDVFESDLIDQIEDAVNDAVEKDLDKTIEEIQQIIDE